MGGYVYNSNGPNGPHGPHGPNGRSHEKWSRAITNAGHLLRDIRRPSQGGGGFWSKLGRAARGGYALGGRFRNALRSTASTQDFFKRKRNRLLLGTSRPGGSVNATPNGLPPPSRNNTPTTHFVNPLHKRINKNNFVKNANGKNVTDPISLGPIPRRYAMELNTQTYNARELKKWVNQKTGMSHTVPHSRRPLTRDNHREMERLIRNNTPRINNSKNPLNDKNNKNTRQWMENQRQYIEKYTQWYKNANSILKHIREGRNSNFWERELKEHMKMQPTPPL